MELEKVILISGLGPGHIEEKDLLNTPFDNSMNYSTKYLGHSLFDLKYRGNEMDLPVLRYKTRGLASDLTTYTLQQILKNSSVKFTYFNTSFIWNDIHLASSDVYNKIILLSTTFMWNEKMVVSSLNWIDSNFKDYTLILGGQYSTLKCDELLDKYQTIDYIIVGDGEKALPMLVDCIFSKNNKNIYDIPNIVYYDKIKKQIVKTTKESIDLDDVALITVDNNEKAMPIMTMRGCYHDCQFCSQPHINDICRVMSLEKIISLINGYINQGVRHFDFVDSTITEPYMRFEGLLDFFINSNITWEANCRVDYPFDQNVVKKMEKSGCKTLAFGFESMADSTLEKMHKGTLSVQNRFVNSIFKDSTILTLMSFIVGFPGESKEDFIYTRDYLLNEHYGQYLLNVFSADDENMPIVTNNKYNLVLLSSNDGYRTDRNGINWIHDGMNSKVARELRDSTISLVRKSSNIAIQRTWLRFVEWPLVEGFDKKTNYEVAKLIDQLIFAFKDYEDVSSAIVDRINQLKKYDICF